MYSILIRAEKLLYEAVKRIREDCILASIIIIKKDSAVLNF